MYRVLKQCSIHGRLTLASIGDVVVVANALEAEKLVREGAVEELQLPPSLPPPPGPYKPDKEANE